MDDKRDRKTVWRVMRRPLKSLTDAGLSVTEVCSLYRSRVLRNRAVHGHELNHREVEELIACARGIADLVEQKRRR